MPELHYSRFKLGRLLAIGLFLAGLFIWFVLDGAILSGDGRGLGSRLARTIGPETLRYLILAVALLSAALALAYLRLLASADSLALRADAQAVTLRTLIGSRIFAWPEVEEVFLRRVATPAGEQGLVVVRGRGRRQAGVAVNALRESVEEAQAWVDAAERMRLGGEGAAGPA
ncbi:MAG: hypothetical protein ACXWUX_16045 [Allosphingosinicella sp.]